jgi:hypothetical protein
MTITTILAGLPISRALDLAGLPAANCLLHTYQAGSSIPLATYQTSDISTPNSNPVLFDSTGTAIIRYLPGVVYKLVLNDPTDTTTLWSVDNFYPPVNASVSTPAEIAASVMPVDYQWPPGDMRRYGGDPTGVADSSLTPWANALAQRVHGGDAIRFCNGLWKGNFIVTGENVDVICESMFYDDTNTVGFIAANNANPVWQLGNGSTLTRSIRLYGLKMHGLGTAAKGLLINSATNVWIDGLIIRGFTTYALSYTASTTLPSAYCFISKYRIDIPAGAASAIAYVHTQPANYPASYATAIFFDEGALIGNTGTLWAVQINANCTVWVGDSYWTMGDGVGINFPDAGGTGKIVASNLAIDTFGTSNDVLVTCADNNPLQQHMYGTFTLNGKVKINGITSAAPLGGASYLGNRTMMLYPSITGTLDFQNTSANKADQTVYANQAMTLFRSGNNFFWSNTAGANIAQGTILELLDAGGVNDGKIQFATSGIQILTGAGAPAAAKPDGSLYLRTDAGAASPLYVRQNGAWAQITLP